MSLPPRYGLWVQRRDSESDGHWHSCFTRGESLCLFETEAGPREILQNGHDNSMYYSSRPFDSKVAPLKARMAHFHGLPNDLVHLKGDLRAFRLGPVSFNPSVVSHDGELYATVRFIAGNESRTRLGRLHLNGEFSDVREISGCGQRAFEDVRLFMRDGRFWATAVVDPRSPRVAVLALDENGNVQRLHVQESPRVEKNWMPFIECGTLKLVYSVDPAPAVLTFSDLTGQVTPRPETMPDAAHIFRGGSQVIEWDGDYLAAIHHINLVDGYPIYLHRLARFDRAMTSVEMSRPFFIHSKGIEFIAGAAEHEGDLVLTFGLADRTSHLTVVRREEVARLFR